jgi:hypothetical protein
MKERASLHDYLVGVGLAIVCAIIAGIIAYVMTA